MRVSRPAFDRRMDAKRLFFRLHVRRLRALLRSAIPAQGHGVVSLPHRTPGRSDLAGQVSFLAQAAMLASSRGEAAQFAMFHGGCADPVEPRVFLHRRVRRIHHDHFVELVGGVFVHPVGVEDAQSATATSSTLFRHAAKVSCELELRDALMHWLTIHLSFVHRTLAAATAHAHAVHHDALLGLVSQPTGLVGTRRTRHAHDRRQLAVFPASHPQQEPQHVALLLPPQLFHVLPGASLPSASRLLASSSDPASPHAPCKLPWRSQRRVEAAPREHVACVRCRRRTDSTPKNPLFLSPTLSFPTLETTPHRCTGGGGEDRKDSGNRTVQDGPSGKGSSAGDGGIEGRSTEESGRKRKSGKGSAEERKPEVRPQGKD